MRRWDRLQVVAIALVFGGSPGLVAAQVPFTSGPGITLPADVSSVVAADVDRDGDLDLVAASSGSPEVIWRENARGIHRASQPLFSREGGVAHLVAADVDRDGLVDLVSITVAGVAVFHRALANPFAIAPSYDARPPFSSALNNVTAMAMGRFGTGGTPELIVARSSAPLLQRFPFEPAQASRFGAPTLVPAVPGASHIAALATADVDGDGLVDVVGSGTRIVSTLPFATLFWTRRTAPTSFGSATEIDSGSQIPSGTTVSFPAFAIGDFNRDSHLDIAYLRNVSDNNASAGVYVRDNTGTGFATGPDARREIDAVEAGVRFHAIAAADIDRDGDLDVVIEDDRPFGFSVLYLQSDGAYAEITTNGTAAPAATALFVGDDDIDGDPDVIVARLEGQVDRFVNRRIHGRAFVPFVRGATASAAFYGAFDGPFDVVPIRFRRSTRTLALFTEFVAGRVGVATMARASDGTLIPVVDTLPVMTDVGAARALSVADIDHDGDDDFLLGTGESSIGEPDNQNRLVLGMNENNVFTRVIQGCQSGDDIRGVALARTGLRPGLENTGFEVLYASHGNDRVAIQGVLCGDEIVLTEGSGNAVNGPSSLQVADMIGSGIGDIVVALRAADSPGVLGNAIGFFPGGLGDLEEMASVRGAADVVVFDYSRDGRPDLATATQGDVDLDPDAGRVLLFRNQGFAVLSPPIVLASGIDEPARVAFSDIDHDGDYDVFFSSESNRSASATRSQCGVFFVEAEGSTTFAPPVCLDDALLLQGRYTRVALADLDQDGIDDVVATSRLDDRIGFFASDALAQALSRHSTDDNSIGLGAGQEHCPRLVDVEHLGRDGDSDIAISSYSIQSTITDTAGVIDALILRRDDGDNVPEPDQDVELGRSTAPVSTGSLHVWTLSVPSTNANGRIRALQGGRYWLCVKGRLPMPSTDQALKLVNPRLDMRDAVSRFRINARSFIPNNSSGTTVLSVALFGDGFEDD